MSLMPLEGVTRLISKAAEVDENGARLLLRFSTFDYLNAEIDRARETIEQDLVTEVTKRTTDARRVLMRSYVSKRVDGDDVEEVIKAATYLAAVSETVSKADVPVVDPLNPVAEEARDTRGRWTKRFADVLSAITGSRPYELAEQVGQQHPDDRLKATGHSLLTGSRYDNLHRAGAVLAATGDPTATAVGGAAVLAAAVGPEAMQVLGPHVQRTAYRYRGTEKTADASLRRDVSAVKPAIVREYQHNPEKATKLRAQVSQGAQLPGNGVLSHYVNTPAGNGMTDQQMTLRIRGDVAVGYLSGKVTDPENTALSIASGQLPPSQGVIINSAGNVVSESMGYNGDHFLPFDLKNLKGLDGGQYVRTRAAGGPTSEDIYTGLLSNARQMQVVSNSGVFTVEFDPDLRGGRRYSDKAHQMIGRYQKLLDAVNSGEKAGLYTNDLSPAEIRGYQKQAFEDARGNEANARILAGEYIDAERNKRKYNVKDSDEIEAEADAAVKEYVQNQPRGGPRISPQDLHDKKREVIEDLYDEQAKTSVKALRLDGEGYFRALKSLQAEFPYYIRSVDFQERPRFLTQRKLIDPRDKLPARDKSSDKGYIGGADVGEARNHARSTAERRSEGYHTVQGKTNTVSGRTVSADETDETVTNGNNKVRPQVNTGRLPEPNAPKLTDLLADRDLARQVGRADDKLKILTDETANEKGLDQDSYKQAKGYGAAAQAAWVNVNFGSGEPLIKSMLNGTVATGRPDCTSEQVTDMYISALKDPAYEAKVHSRGFADEEMVKEGLAGKATVLAALSFRQPFAPGGDVLTAGREAVYEHSKPMKYDDIDEAGISQANLDAVKKMLPGKVQAQIDVYNTPGALPPLEQLTDTYSQFDHANKDDSLTPGQKANARSIAIADLDVQHKAWAFVYAEKLAAEGRALTGREPSSPKASPPGEHGAQSLVSQSFNTEKRHQLRRPITVHPAGSELATQFQKFLRTQAPSTTPPRRPTRG